MPTSTTQGLRVFVSAPYDTVLRPLLDGLRNAGLDAFVSSDVATLGGDLVQSARSAIDAADLVLIVLTQRPSVDPIFEAGMAAALGKRIVLVSEPGAALPSELQSFVVVHAALDDVEPVVLALREVAQRRLIPTPTHVKPVGQPLGPARAKSILRQLEAETPSEVQVRDVLVEAISGTGAITIEGRDSDGGRDIGVWSDDLAAIGGNPLVIEIKRQLVPAAVDQLRAYVGSQRPIRLGLLVVLEEPTDDALRRAMPGGWFPVLVISLRNLVEKLGAQSFARVVTDLRNRAVHGWPQP
jgi:hypothetical protein